MTTAAVAGAVARGRLWAEASPLIPGQSGWALLLGTLVVWGLIAFAAYLVIRLAVRHALQDVARSSGSDVEPRTGHVDAG
jgi:hypothetical protein